MISKCQKRKFRVLRLLAITQAYHHYTMMQMHRKALFFDNTWKDAEHLSNWLNVLMPYHKTSPSDFLHDKNEISDEVLDNYSKFKQWQQTAESVGISEKTLTAFCKSVDNLQCAFFLKAFGHVFYPDWLLALHLYLENEISKRELQNRIFEISLFEGKIKPANVAMFRETILDIEKNILQIASKQLHREVKRHRELLEVL